MGVSFNSSKLPFRSGELVFSFSNVLGHDLVLVTGIPFLQSLSSAAVLGKMFVGVLVKRYAFIHVEVGC